MTFKFTSMLSAAVLATAMMSSCSDNDDPVSVKDVMGNYSGQLVANPLPKVNPQAEGEQVYTAAALVKADSMFVDIFEMTEKVLKSVGKDDVPPVEKITCKIAYTPTLSKANDSISLKLDPQPIVYYAKDDVTSETDTIVIKVKAADLGAYAVSSKKMKLGLITGEVTVNGKPYEVDDDYTLSFDLVKK